MPQLPEFNAPLAPNPAPPALAPIGAGGVAAGALAAGAERFENVADQFAERYAAANRQATAADITAQTSSQLADIEHKWSLVPDREKAGAGYQQEADQLVKTTTAGISDPIVRGDVEARISREAGDRGISTRAAAFGRQAEQQIGNLDLHLTSYAQQLAAARDNPALQATLKQNAIDEINGSVATGWMNGEAGAQKLIGFRQNTARIAAEQDRNDVLASKDPAAAAAWAKQINDPTYLPDLNPQVRETLGYRADYMADRIAAQNQVAARGAVRAAFSDNLAAIERTGAPAVPLSTAQIRAAYPEEADSMVAQLNRTRDLYHAVQSTGLTSPQEDAALIEKWAPQGAGFAVQANAQDALRQALAQKYKTLGTDPAAYVLGASPDIKGLFDSAAKDPTQLTPAIAALDAAYDRIGVAPEARHVLTAPAAQHLADTITASATQAPATFKTLAAQYGDDWPRAWRDLTTIGGLPATWQAVPTLDNERDGAMLARWLGEVPKGKTAGDLLGTKAENDIKTSVRSDPGVQSLLTSLSRSGSSAGQVDSALQAIDALGFAKSYYDRDPKAAQNAIASFTSKYEFMPNGGARVPRDQFDDVTTRAGATIGGLALDQLAMPAGYGRPGMPAPQEFVEWLKAAPSWITSPKADAVWLMDPTGRIVRGKDGKPVAVPFTAPAAQGAAAPAVPEAGAAPPARPGEFIP